MGIRRKILAAGPTWRLLVDQNERLYYEYELSADVGCCFSLLSEVSALYQRRFDRELRKLGINAVYVEREEIRGDVIRSAVYEARKRCPTTTWDSEKPYDGPITSLSSELVRDAVRPRMARPRKFRPE